MIKEILSSGEGGKTPGSKIASPLLYYFTLQILPDLQRAHISAFFFSSYYPPSFPFRNLWNPSTPLHIRPSMWPTNLFFCLILYVAHQKSGLGSHAVGHINLGISQFFLNFFSCPLL